MEPNTPTEPALAEETNPPVAHTGTAALRRAADTIAVGLSAVAALYVLFSIGAGLAFQERQFPGDDLHRVGLVAASAIDLRIGLTLVVAIALTAAGAHLDRTTSSPSVRVASVLTAATAVVVVILAALAVRAQYHQLDLRNTTATTAFNLSQATYVVGSIGPAIIALLAVVPVLGGDRRR